MDLIKFEWRVNADIIRELWSRTYNSDGKPDWSHIFPYYHEDIVFQDVIQKIQGIENFKKMCNRLSNRCKNLRMDIIDITQKDNVIMMDWKMTMSFKKFPDTPVYGSTKFILHEEDGRIINQRDYYDLWGDVFNGIPKFCSAYRLFMKRYFG